MADKSLSERKEGARRMRSYVQELALKAGIKIIKMTWEPEIREAYENYTLIVETKKGMRQAHFSRKEIEIYPGEVEIEDTQAKIQRIF